MLITIVSVIVVPTYRYHELSKSMYFPLNIGNPSGSLSSGIFELTKIRRSTVLIHSYKKSLGTVEVFSRVLFTNLWKTEDPRKLSLDNIIIFTNYDCCEDFIDYF